MLSKRVLVSSLTLSVAFACAEAQDDSNGSSDDDAHEGGKSGAGQGGAAGKLVSAGTTSVSQGATSALGGAGTSGNAGNGGSAGKSGSGGASGSANGGSASGGRAGSGSGGTNGGSSAGTSGAGTGSTGLACVEEAAAGAASGGADAGGAGAGGAPAMGGAPGMGGALGMGGAPGALELFFDDFESGSSKWTTTLGTWALSADGSQVFEQSVEENKLQVAIANGVCAADQVIDAKIKIVAFKGQSNSYMAALFGRALSPTTHYLLALGSDGKLALRKRINSSSTGATAIGSAVTTTLAAGQWYDVHFELIGTSLKGCVGAVCVTGTDSSIASGSVGVGTVNTSARFDDVRLTAP